MREDLSGIHFGKLTAIKFAYYHGGQCYWLCSCDCGHDVVVRASHLKSGHTASCGCQKGNKTHGESKTRLYTIWNNMRERCSNPNNRSYYLYGARGIRVDPSWDDYQTFREWALSNGYKDSLTIDRINNNLGYCPSNCRWATVKEQANNTRRNRLITYKGETHSLSEWARLLGIKQSTLSMRINKYNWPIEEAFGKVGRENVS